MARNWFWTGTILCLVMVFQTGTANQFQVGGKRGWVPPSGSDETLNQWAERNRFLINDTLIFKYDPSVDSVLQVTKQDYDTCTTTNPLNSSKDGNTVFQFPRHSYFYFISGNVSNCQKGEKVVIVVLAPRNVRGKSSVAPSPSPTVASPPPSSVAPSPAPSTIASPPSVVPVTSPSVAPLVSPTPALVPSMGSGPAMTPGNSAPFFTSPGPAPSVSEGGVVPSKSAGNDVRPRVASAVFVIVVLAISGAF